MNLVVTRSAFKIIFLDLDEEEYGAEDAIAESITRL